MSHVIIESYDRYNHRRYSSPWVCLMRADGTYDFDHRVGLYTGDVRTGGGGDLVVIDPVPGQVYGYGQRDRRGNHTIIRYAKWDGAQFVPCNMLGQQKSN